MRNHSSDKVTEDEDSEVIEARVVGATEHTSKGLTRTPPSHS